MNIDTKTIKQVHDIFETLGYKVDKYIDYETFVIKVFNIFARAKNINEAIKIAIIIDFCNKNWVIIDEILKNHLDKFNKIPYKKNLNIKKVSKKSAIGRYYFTNFLLPDLGTITMTNVLKNIPFLAEFKDDKFYLTSDYQYYLKYEKDDVERISLYDNKDNFLGNFAFSNCLNFGFEENNTPYRIILFEDRVEIYHKNYIESLKEDEIPQYEKAIANIKWSTFYDDSLRAISELEVEEESDFELLILFAVVPLLLYQRGTINPDVTKKT